MNTVDRIMILAFCPSSDGHLSMYLSFNSLVFIHRYAPDKLFIVKNIKVSNSVNTVDRVTILALCIFADDPLTTDQVSFNSLVYFQRYAPDKHLIAKMKKESNSVNTVDRVMVLALCNSPHAPLLMHQVILNYL